jgi:TetR/AcrR family transcriptional repressor of nem operon
VVDEVVDEVIAERIHLTFIKPLPFFENPVNDFIELIRRSGSDLSIADIKLACSLTNLAQAMAPINEGFRARLVKIYEQWCQAIVIAVVRTKQAN